MPESTEQILHPEKYAANEAPVAVTLPADLATQLGTGWTVPLTDTFGEFQTAIWLRGAGVDEPAASDAAAGWGGDRLAVINGPDGRLGDASSWKMWGTPNCGKGEPGQTGHVGHGVSGARFRDVRVGVMS